MLFDYDALEHVLPPPEANRVQSMIDASEARPNGQSHLSKPMLCNDFVERVWAMSDIHTDVPENLQFIEQLDGSSYQRDVLVIAGDISDSMVTIRRTLRSLRSKFAHVFFVPGNHDLWLRTKETESKECQHIYSDSLAKKVAIEKLCAEERVETRPRQLFVARSHASLWIVPLLSWHCQAFDTEPDIDPRWEGIPSAGDLCSDYILCKWPPPLDSVGGLTVAEHFDALNDEARDSNALLDSLYAGVREPADTIISFSHFLPRIELLPEKRYLYFPPLAKIVGSPMLGQRVEHLKPDVHVFGHTHFGWDQVIDGVRYISPPLAMPRERAVRLSTVATGGFPSDASAVEDQENAPQPLLVWDSTYGFPQHYEAAWSNFYEHYKREPSEVLVLPNYVADNYRWDESKHGPKSDVVGWAGKTPAWHFGPEWTRKRARHF